MVTVLKTLDTILILTETNDPHVDRVVQKLQQHNAIFFRFNPKEFPSKAEVSLSFSPTGNIQYVLYLDEDSIPLDRVKSVWYRRPMSPIADKDITNELSRSFVEDECNIFVNDLWSSLSLDCLWIPSHPLMIQRAQFKATQLKLAASLGFEIPPTLFTNRPEDFIEFYNHHNGNIISKPAGFSFFRLLGKTFCRYTEFVSKRDVAYAQAIRYCPVIFQAYVSKCIELRITVVGQQVFAAEIHSQESNHTRHDWRRYDHYKTLYCSHELPQDLSQRCLQLVERLGLCYGAIDMVLTPDGQYIFLEINPNGQYLWIEEATGIPISDSICDLLISGHRK